MPLGDYDIVYDSRLSFGVRLANGSYNGIMGLLESGDVDLAAAPMLMREDRAQVSIYAPFMYTSECGLIAVAREPSINVFSYLFVFDWELLIVNSTEMEEIIINNILTRLLQDKGLSDISSTDPVPGHLPAPYPRKLLFLMHPPNILPPPLLVLSLGIQIKSALTDARVSFWSCSREWGTSLTFSFSVPKFSLKIWHSIETKTNAGRLLFSVWWLTVAVLMNGFAGQLKASMAIKSEPPRFRSVEDISSHPDIRPLIWRDTAFEAYVRVSSRPLLRALTRQVHQYGGPVFISEMFSEDAIEQLYARQADIVSDRDVTLHMLAKQCRLTGGRLYVAPDLLFTRLLSMTHAKNMLPELQRRIRRKYNESHHGTGVHLKWFQGGMEEWHRCQAVQGAGTSQASELSFKVLRYDDMAAMFALWAIMAAFSLMVFVLELCYHRTAAGRRYRLARISTRRNARCRRHCAAQGTHPPA
ncbi:uncharacterized protein LOC144097983 [Amblyomma americanum]